MLSCRFFIPIYKCKTNEESVCEKRKGEKKMKNNRTEYGVKVGDKVNLKPSNLAAEAVVLSAEVIYVHPEGRFIRVEFTMEGGEKITESFCPWGPGGFTGRV